MHSRVSAATVACAFTIFAGCSGQPQSNLTPGGSMTRPLMRETTVTETVLHTFAGGPNDGALPSPSLIDVNGAFYGTTAYGGVYGRGTIFSMTTSGAVTVLHSFTHAEGEYPLAGLANVNGVLYGTTSGGGTSDAGTVFRVTTSGSEKKLHSFAGGADGERPSADLIDVDGTLYGTTYTGGGSANCLRGCGTIFSVTTKGTETVLHRFAGYPSDGAYPPASLTSVNGTLYGVTYKGGASDAGTAFSITTAGVYRLLHSFGSTLRDGYWPLGNLIKVGGKLYGTTSVTVFRLTKSGIVRTLYSFDYPPVQVCCPNSGLTNVGGVLYGTTTGGGLGNGNHGSVFQISTDRKFSNLYIFRGSPTDGDGPRGLIYVDGTLYGTTSAGGVGGGYGTVFSLSGF